MSVVFNPEMAVVDRALICAAESIEIAMDTSWWRFARPPWPDRSK
jgi:hypothetical protein